MAQFALVYLGGNPPATPLKDTRSVSAEGVTQGGSIGMSGYTIIEVDTIEAAVEAAQSCPFVDIGGTIEVSQIMEMPCSK